MIRRVSSGKSSKLGSMAACTRSRYGLLIVRESVVLPDQLVLMRSLESHFNKIDMCDPVKSESKWPTQVYKHLQVICHASAIVSDLRSS